MSDEKGRVRPKYLKMGAAGVGTGAPENDTLLGDRAPAFTVTRGELGAIVAQAVASALGQGAPLLVDRQGLARALGCSPGQVDALRKRGLPTTMVGQLPRFEPALVVEWLRKDGAA